MKVVPVGGHITSTQAQTTAPDSRQRAINAFNQAQQAPVTNPSSVSPEEMTALKPRQNDTNQVLESKAADTPATTEAPAEAPKAPETPAEDPNLSRQFAQLARQEKALRARAQQQDQAIRAKEAALAEREAAIAAKAQQVDLSKYVPIERIKEQTLAVLAEAGVSYDQVAERMINQVPTDPRIEATINRLAEQNAKLEAKLADFEKSQVTNSQAQYDAAVKQITADTKALVSKDPSYEMIKASGAIKDVVELIEETYKKDGILLTVEEAAQEVEDYLVEEASKFAKLSKVQKRLQPVAPPVTTTAAQTPPAQPQQPQMRTLTNATSSTRKLTARERAILAFKNELK